MVKLDFKWLKNSVKKLAHNVLKPLKKIDFFSKNKSFQKLFNRVKPKDKLSIEAIQKKMLKPIDAVRRLSTGKYPKGKAGEALKAADLAELHKLTVSGAGLAASTVAGPAGAAAAAGLTQAGIKAAQVIKDGDLSALQQELANLGSVGAKEYFANRTTDVLAKAAGTVIPGSAPVVKGVGNLAGLTV